MSDNNSVMKLVSNKLFITLLVFAIGIVMVSAVFTRNAREVAQNEEEHQQVSVVSETEDAEIEESEIIEDFEVVEEFAEPVEVVEEYVIEEAEVEEVMEEIFYRMPISGELQKEFSIEELLWDETMQDWRTHCGIDIAADTGTEVDIAAPGTVTEVYEDEMYGTVVKVQHADGNVTVYKNLEKSVVKKDDILDEGQMIGTVGNTGSFEMAQKPHLHFEIILEGKYINPLEFIK